MHGFSLSNKHGVASQFTATLRVACRVKLSYRSGILDQYQLKSLDNILEKAPLDTFRLTNVTVQYEEEDGEGAGSPGGPLIPHHRRLHKLPPRLHSTPS